MMLDRHKDCFQKSLKVSSPARVRYLGAMYVLYIVGSGQLHFIVSTAIVRGQCIFCDIFENPEFRAFAHLRLIQFNDF